jgi:hypothetical protein
MFLERVLFQKTAGNGVIPGGRDIGGLYDPPYPAGYSSTSSEGHAKRDEAIHSFHSRFRNSLSSVNIALGMKPCT